MPVNSRGFILGNCLKLGEDKTSLFKTGPEQALHWRFDKGFQGSNQPYMVEGLPYVFGLVALPRPGLLSSLPLGKTFANVLPNVTHWQWNRPRWNTLVTPFGKIWQRCFKHFQEWQCSFVYINTLLLLGRKAETRLPRKEMSVTRFVSENKLHRDPSAKASGLARWGS